MKNEHIKDVVVYLRTASESQSEQSTSSSINQQKEVIKKFLKDVVMEEFGLTNIAIYEDKGYGGNSLDRPGLNKLRAAIDNGECDMVVVSNVDRLSRSFPVQCQLICEMEAKGVVVESCTMPTVVVEDEDCPNFLALKQLLEESNEDYQAYEKEE